jgi:murein hydrolase activator
LGALTGAFIFGTPTVAAAQGSTTVQTRGESLSQQRLKKLDQEISTREAKAKAYEQEVARTRREYAALQQQLVTLARQSRDVEQDIDETQDRLAEQRTADREASKALAEHAADMAETLAAMQRLSQHPSTALMAKPEDIDTMARTALLFDAILPSLRSQADILRQKIAAVETIRTSIRADQHRLQERQAVLQGQRSKMTGLMATKQQQQKKLSRALDAERRRIAALAKKAKNLTELIDRLGAPTSGTVRDEFADIGRPLDSLPFKTAKGRLSLPAPGVVVSRFGQRGADGQRSKGIRMEPTGQAQIVSLWDGNIVFAGPFRDYGQLLIISHGGGYHSLLAGMGHIDVDIAQWVLAGEPIGHMYAANNKIADNSKPRLYIELRQDGRSIDPLPWMAVSQRKVKR